MKHRKQRQKRGFTLIELMIVVGIIIILASIGIPQYVQYKKNANRAKCVSNLRIVLEAKMACSINSQNKQQNTPAINNLAQSGYFRGSTSGSDYPQCPETSATYNLNWTSWSHPEYVPECPYGVANTDAGHELKIKRTN